MFGRSVLEDTSDDDGGEAAVDNGLAPTELKRPGFHESSKE